MILTASFVSSKIIDCLEDRVTRKGIGWCRLRQYVDVGRNCISPRESGGVQGDGTSKKPCALDIRTEFAMLDALPRADHAYSSARM